MIGIAAVATAGRRLVTMDVPKTAGGVMIALGALDLAFGTQQQIVIPGTDIAIFPAPFSNVLTQQMDLILIAGGLAIWFFA